LAVIAAALLVVGSAAGQQTTGTPGSPNATTTIDGRYLPQPPASRGEARKDGAGLGRTEGRQHVEVGPLKVGGIDRGRGAV
jgi:hypothetical protein